MTTFGIDRNLRQSLADELPLAENATEFWMMTKEAGDPAPAKKAMRRRFMWRGSGRSLEADKIDWVFMVNEIEK